MSSSQDSGHNIRFVRVIWVDLANFIRYRVVPLAHFTKLVKDNDRSESQTRKDGNATLVVNPRNGIQLTKASLGLVYLTLADGFPVAGEYIYVPDPTTTRRLDFAPGHASVFGYFEEKEVTPAVKAESAFRAALCPRALLRKIVREAKESDEVEFLIGFETEVIFLESVDPIVAVNDYGWSETGAILAGQKAERALEEIALALESAGIELQMYHSEAAPGQYEIVTGPLPPLEACDALIITREIIRNVTAKHGLHSTLAPRVYSDSCGSAAHTHISLKSKSVSWSKEAPPAAAAGAMSALEASFVAGLLAHIRGATAFTLPTHASYARMVDGAWSGGTWAAWGRDNRETPVRLCGRGAHDVHFEVKSVDGTAVPHLAAAALLAAGMAGVRAREQLHVRGVKMVPNELSEHERERAGISTRMPLAIEDARAALDGDDVLKKALGEEFVKSFLSVNKTLNKELEAPTPEGAMTKLVKTF